MDIDDHLHSVRSRRKLPLPVSLSASSDPTSSRSRSEESIAMRPSVGADNKSTDSRTSTPRPFTRLQPLNVAANASGNQLSNRTDVALIESPQKTRLDIHNPRKVLSVDLGNKDGNLISVMSSRLLTVKLKLKSARAEVQTNRETIKKLESECSFLKALQPQQENAQITMLQDRCRLYENQVKEMERFLLSYNMVWDAEDRHFIDDIANKCESSNAKESHGRHLNQLPCTIQELIMKIQELNDIAGDEKHMITRHDGVHTLEESPKLPVTVYKDGFSLNGSSFRSYEDQSTQLFFRDILDGYFPYELKNQYPNGVRLDVIDRTSVPYTQHVNSNSKKGSKMHDIKWLQEGGSANNPLTKDTFLSKLPKQVIKDGKIVDVRKSITEIVNAYESHTGRGSYQDVEDNDTTCSVIPSPSPSPPPSNYTDAYASTVLTLPTWTCSPTISSTDPAIMSKTHLSHTLLTKTFKAATFVHIPTHVDSSNTLPSDPTTPKPFTTLRVRTPEGQEYLLKLLYTDTMALLRTYLDKTLATCAYTLHSPRYSAAATTVAYSDLECTTSNYGLIPNAKLYLEWTKMLL